MVATKDASNRPVVVKHQAATAKSSDMDGVCSILETGISNMREAELKGSAFFLGCQRIPIPLALPCASHSLHAGTLCEPSSGTFPNLPDGKIKPPRCGADCTKPIGFRTEMVAITGPPAKVECWEHSYTGQSPVTGFRRDS